VDNRIRGDYCSCAYWYQDGTPAPLSPLPAGSLAPSPWWAHALQLLALPAVGPLALLAAAPELVRFLRRAREARQRRLPEGDG